MSDVVTCVRCNATKAVRAFDRDASRESGRYPWCKLCRKKYSPKSQQGIEDPLNGHDCPLCDTPIRGHANRRFCSSYCKDRTAALKKKYGLTVLEYRKLVDDTGGRCPICQCRPRKWAVDHDHRTGLVTGVVCTGCNVGLLAHSKHDLMTARRFFEYLSLPPARRLEIYAIAADDLNSGSKIHEMWNHTRKGDAS